MDRKAIIAANWKMFKTREKARATVRELLSLLKDTAGVEVLVCPPFTALGAVGRLIAESSVQLGGQNVHWDDQGAYTGEVSVSMLLDCSCRYVILGHSERRQLFHESDEIIHLKMKKVAEIELAPILCVGESLEERERDRVEKVILGQLAGALADMSADQISDMVVAYEPVWAIGTGKTATPEIAEQVHAMIRNWLAEQFSPEFAAAIRILYGGSVKPENTAHLMGQENIDGGLVGGASLEAQSFARIVEACASATGA